MKIPGSNEEPLLLSNFARATLAILVVLLGATSVPAAGPETWTVPGGFRVTRPGDQWSWVADRKDPTGVTLTFRRDGVDVVLRWVKNPAALPSQRLARQLRDRLLLARNSTGKAFSPIRPARVGRAAAAGFTEEQDTPTNGVHRTEYTLLARGKSCLLVAVMGGRARLEKHRGELDRVLASITFPRR